METSKCYIQKNNRSKFHKIKLKNTEKAGMLSQQMLLGKLKNPETALK